MEKEKLIWDYGNLDGDYSPEDDEEADEDEYPWWD